VNIAEVVFWSAGSAVFYAYVGYPLLISLLASIRPKHVKKATYTPSVTLIIVAHDEETRIERKLRNCLDLDYPKDRLEIIVASDGSCDRTDEIVGAFADRGVRLLALPGPRGKAAALNEAVLQARGTVLILSDTRQTFESGAIRELVDNFSDTEVGAVSGELHLAVSSETPGAEGMGLYWKYEKLLRRMESRFDSSVGVTGAIYAVRKELVGKLDPRCILDDVAIPMNLALSGYRVVFEPRAVAYDKLADSPHQEYRRKVRTLAGNFQLVRLYPRLLDPLRNRLVWQFVSHKLARLAVPWLLVALLPANAFLALGDSVFYKVAFWAQVIFYGLAVLGWVWKAPGAKSKWLAAPFAFVLFNLAAVRGLVGFFRGTERAAWKESLAATHEP
jgi:biofilm PGA synthesis N-glycosyltransferase PgaC